METANFVSGVGSMIARRLLHEDFLSFSEFSIEICALDVDLMEFHVLSSGHSQNGSNQRKLGNGSKSVKVVNTGHLRESLGNKTCLVVDDIPGSIFLRTVNPFQAHNVGPSRWIGKFPGTSFL